MTTTYRPRVDPPLTERFAKDPAEEHFLGGLNAALAAFEDEGYRDLPESLPTLHIVGSPRSGTTLLYQLIATGLDVGYVNNLIASFWRAPATGVRLSRKLRLHQPDSRFASDFGRTAGIAEPHEFGYFWNHHLRYPDLAERPDGHEETIDWLTLRRAIVNMAHAHGGPFVFKPMLLTWHLETMLRVMPRTCYVWIRRDQRDTALSLLKMRVSLFGGYERWASLRPLVDLEGEPPWRQVAAQVVLIERLLERVCDRLGAEHMLAIRYERLCAEPAAVLSDIRDLLGSKGHPPSLRAGDLPELSEGRNAALQEEFGSRVDEALAHFREAFADAPPVRVT